NHTAFLGFGQTPLNAVQTPLKTFFFGVAGQDRFDAAVGHEGVEIDRVPASGVDPNAGDAELIGDLNALLRVLDIFTDNFRFRADKILVSREADQVNAVGKREPLQFVARRAPSRVEGGLLIDVHLAMENIDSVDADLRGFLDHRFNRNFRWPKVPIGVS